MRIVPILKMALRTSLANQDASLKLASLKIAPTMRDQPRSFGRNMCLKSHQACLNQETWEALTIPYHWLCSCHGLWFFFVSWKELNQVERYDKKPTVQRETQLNGPHFLFRWFISLPHFPMWFWLLCWFVEWLCLEPWQGLKPCSFQKIGPSCWNLQCGERQLSKCFSLWAFPGEASWCLALTTSSITKSTLMLALSPAWISSLLSLLQWSSFQCWDFCLNNLAFQSKMLLKEGKAWPLLFTQQPWLSCLYLGFGPFCSLPCCFSWAWILNLPCWKLPWLHCMMPILNSETTRSNWQALLVPLATSWVSLAPPTRANMSWIWWTLMEQVLQSFGLLSGNVQLSCGSMEWGTFAKTSNSCLALSPIGSGRFAGLSLHPCFCWCFSFLQWWPGKIPSKSKICRIL